MKCPICNSKLKRKKVPYNFGSVSFGIFDADTCSKCGEVFFTEESSDAIDAKAKSLGLWGLEKKSRISYSGNSMIVRIPKSIAEFMKLRKGEEILIRPEDAKKLVIEIA